MPPPKITPISAALYGYLEQHSFPAHPILPRLAEENSKLPDGGMQIPNHEAGFIHLLVKLCAAKSIVELGCYTGYSAIALASALGDDGHLTTFDNDPKTSSTANRNFAAAGLDRKITLILGPALITFPKFLETIPPMSLDLAFIDADKVSYELYFELCLQGIRPGGLILIDNAFRDGEILAPAPKDRGTQAVDRLTRKIQTDTRIESTMLPIADGLILVRKK